MALAILAAVFALVLAPEAAQGPIFGTITGPPALAPRQVSAYSLTINGGPTGAATHPVPWHPNRGGLPAGTRKIARLNPGAQVTETFAYLPSGLQPGTHQVRVEADLDGNGIIDPAKGEAVATSLFYRGTAPLSTAWTVLIGIGVFVPVMLLTIALRRRKRA